MPEQKNEDGALVWSNGHWEFAAILDGHNSAESVDLVVNTIQKEYENIKEMMNESIDKVFRSIENHILTIFQSSSFKEKCQKELKVKQLALCVRKVVAIYWRLLVYVFHEELHKLGQYALNQRHFTNGLEM